MAVVNLTPDIVVESGVAANYNSGLSTGNTYKIRNNNRTILHVKKSGAGACTVTVKAQASVRGHTVADETIVVPATTGDVFIGPFPHDLYNDVNNDVSFTLSEVTGLTVAVLQF